MKKRMLSLLMAAVMVFSLMNPMAVTAYAEETAEPEAAQTTTVPDEGAADVQGDPAAEASAQNPGEPLTASAGEPGPAADTAPVAEPGPAADTAPVAEAGPAADTAPVAEGGPAADTAPAAEAGPAANTAPVAEAGPAAQTLFGDEAERYIVAGVSKLCGSFWDNIDLNNEMTGSDGVYRKVYTAVAPGSYELKVVHWDAVGNCTWYGDASGNNISFYVAETCDITVEFTVATKEIRVLGDGIGEAPEAPVEIVAVGQGADGFLYDVSWSPDSDDNLMSSDGDGVYTITYENVRGGGSHQFYFATYDSWAETWKTGVTVGLEQSGTWYNVVKNGYDNMTLDATGWQGAADVTLTLDLANNRFKVDIETSSKLYNVTLPTGDGYTVQAAEGYGASAVSGGSYCFTVAIADGWDAANMVVKANGVTLTAVDGMYTISDIWENQTITVTGVEYLPQQLVVSGGTNGTDYRFRDNALTVLTGTPLTISGTCTTERVVVAENVTANLTLKNLSIDCGNQRDSALGVLGAANITLEGDNTLQGGENHAGLQVCAGASVVIDGAGSLQALGGDSGAGIGGISRQGSGSITIHSGNVTATGGSHAAGIGGGLSGAGGDVCITGGNVTATGNGGASGIGWGVSSGNAGTFSTGENGNAYIVASTIADKSGLDTWNGIIFEESEGGLFGADVTLQCDGEVPAGRSLIIAEDQRLTIAAGVTLTNYGTILNYGILVKEGTLDNQGTIYEGATGNCGDFYVTGGIADKDYTFENNCLTVLTDSPLTISGTTTTDTIKVPVGVNANLTLHEVHIDVSGTSEACAVLVEDTASITLKGENSLKSGAYRAGLQINQKTGDTHTTKLVIDGSGRLAAVGGARSAGIGGSGDGYASGQIIIEGGTITATGGTGAAGIGGGQGGACVVRINGGTIVASGSDTGPGIGGGYLAGSATIMINDGKITATGGSAGGAGIGVGTNANGAMVDIFGGVITATGGDGGAGIGNGKSSTGEKTYRINIRDGHVTATGGGTALGIGDSTAGSAGTFTTGTNGSAYIVANGIADRDDTSEWSGIIFDGYRNGLFGSEVSMKYDAEIPAGKTLTIAEGQSLTMGAGTTLTNNGTLMNRGALTLNGKLVNYGTFTQSGTLNKQENFTNHGSYVSDGHTVMGGLTVTGGTYGKDFTYENNVLTVLTDTAITISGSTTQDTIVAKGDSGAAKYPKITLQDLHMDLSDTDKACAFEVQGRAYITLAGENTLKSGKYRAGLQANQGKVVDISGDGTLTAEGGADAPGIGGIDGTGTVKIWGGTIVARGGLYGTGIGGGYGERAGSIYVEGGHVTAIGGIEGAGIGVGYKGSGGSIFIDGGTVIATGGYGSAGIGGSMESTNGTVTVRGGIVTATGGGYAAGIGGGYKGTGIAVHVKAGTVTATGTDRGAGIGGGAEGSCGEINISGGTVEVTGTGRYGTGIGSGYNGSCEKVSITGGTVTATGSYGGAGIGSGYSGSCTEIAISDGTVTATGGYGGAGIGGGFYNGAGTITITGGVVTGNGGDGGTGIGAGLAGNYGTVTITGGTVTGNGSDGAYGIGNSSVGTGCTVSTGESGTAIIYTNLMDEAAMDEACSAILFVGEAGTVYGSQTITGDMTIPDGYSLHIPEGATLNIPEGASLTMDGSFTHAGTLNNNGIIYTGTATMLGDLSVEGGIYGVDYTYENNQFTIETTTPLVFSGTTTKNSIAAKKHVNLTLKDLHIHVDGCPVYVRQANITLAGENSLKSSGSSPGLGVIASGVITIQGTGSLYAEGGNTSAGIGGQNSNGDVRINIDGGTITAQGGTGGAGIGAGVLGSATIQINGGTVTSAGGAGGAGIGAGCGKTNPVVPSHYSEASVVIWKGTVTARGGAGAAGIGSGEYSSKVILVRITGGTVTAMGGEGAQDIGTGSGNDNTFDTFDIKGGNAFIMAEEITGSDNTSGWGGVIFTGTERQGAVYGDYVALNTDAAIPSDYTLTIPEGCELTTLEGVTLTNNGVIRHGDATYYGDLQVSGGEYGKDFTYSDNTLTILTDTALTLSGSTTKDRVEVKAPDGKTANLTLQDLHIVPAKSENDDYYNAFYLYGNAAITLLGKNTLSGQQTPFENYGGTGLWLDKDAALEITAESTGSLTAIGKGSSGIGRQTGAGNNKITINGGVINAEGGGNNAGIVVGWSDTLIINDGTVNASGGTGIGGIQNQSSGNIQINGGTVNARSTSDGAAIGGGDRGACGTVTITGGTVNAVGKYSAAIGGGRDAQGGTVTISGGVVHATSAYVNMGINSDVFSTGENGTALIITDGIADADDTSAWSGLIYAGDVSGVYGGDFILPEDLTVKRGDTFTIPEGCTLTIAEEVTLTNKWTIVNDGTIVNNGTIINEHTITGSGSVTGNAVDVREIAYYLFGRINGENYGTSIGQDDYQFIDGKLTVRFTQDSRVGVRWGKDTYFDSGTMLGTATEATMYETKAPSNVCYLYVPGNTDVILTLTENDDGSLHLSYKVPSKMVYFVNDLGMDFVNIYYWNEGGEISWPGNSMTFAFEDENGFDVYSYEVPAGMNNIIFNGSHVSPEGNTSSIQTVDIGGFAACGYYWFTNMGTDGKYNVAVKEKHTVGDDNICDYCEKQVKMESIKVSLGTDITMKYYVTGHFADNTKMRFTVNGCTKTVEAACEDNKGRLEFVFDGVAPQWMGDTVTAELLVGDKVAETKDYSVVEYLNTLKSKTAAQLGYSEAKYTSMVTLIDDLLVYGGAAQTYKNYKTDNLVSTGITGSPYVPLTETDAKLTRGTYVTCTGATLWFDSVNKLMFRFTADDLTGVTFKLKMGESEVPFDFTDNGDGSYIVTSPAIYAIGFDNVYTITAYKDGVADTSLQYSVKSYVKSMQDKTTPIAELAKATNNYGLSTIAFRNTV